MSLGPFAQTRFFGASVVQATADIGWGTQGSELSITLVEDPCQGSRVDYDDDGNAIIQSNVVDMFDPPRLGKPGYFKFGTFSFGGLLTNWEQTKDIGGGTNYRVKIAAPTEILAGAQIILKGYNGSVFGIPNLFNASNWCNDAGVTWGAIQYLIHGGLFYLKGCTYMLDVSEVPAYDYRFTGDSVSVLDAINAAANNLGGNIYVELIHNGSGLSLLSGVEGFIKIRFSGTTSIVNPAVFVDVNTGTDADTRLSYGIIANFAGSSTCDQGVPRQSRGIELAHTITNALLVGDNYQTIWTVTNNVVESFDDNHYTANAVIRPFWGLDGNGNVIVDSGSTNDRNFNVDITNLNLNIGGGTTYNINMWELRAALYSYDSWLSYMAAKKSAILQALIGGANPFSLIDVAHLYTEINSKANNANHKFNTQSIFKASKNNAVEAAKAHQKGTLDASQKLFDFVHGIGQEYYGKKWLVPLPFIACCSGTGDIETKQSWERTEGGWYNGDVIGLAAGSAELEVFKIDDGRIGPIAYFQDDDNLDLYDITAPFYATDMKHVWVKAAFEEIVQPCSGSPYAVVSLNGMIHNDESHKNDVVNLDNALFLFLAQEGKRTATGNPADTLTAAQKDAVKALFKQAGADGFMSLGLIQEFQVPDVVTVPLKSNVISYGPWYANTSGTISLAPAGKTHYERDTNLNPWNFGSSAALDAAGSLLVATTLSYQQTLEAGSITVTGAPIVSSLGRYIQSGGPNLTGINIDYGIQGVQTTYRVRTHVKNFGEIARQRVQWMEHMGKNMQKFQRAFNQGVAAGHPANQQWMQMQLMGKGKHKKHGRPSHMKGFHSSHAFILSSYATRSLAADTQKVEMVMTSMPKAVRELNADADAEYIKMAGADISSLLRPYDTDPYSATWAHFIIPNSGLCGASGKLGENALGNPRYMSLPPIPPVTYDKHLPITISTTNPFLASGGTLGTSVGHDIEYVVRDGVYPTELSIFSNSNTYGDKYRAIALKGPLVIAGWGYDIDGYPVPNKNSSYPTSRDMEFAQDWLSKPQTWKAGTVDLRWDELRGMWVSPPGFKIVRATLAEDLIPTAYGGSGKASGSLDESRQTGTIYINDYLGQPINNGSKVVAYFDPDTCEYIVLNSQYRPLCVTTNICTQDDGSCSGYPRMKITGYTRTIYVNSAVSPPSGTVLATGVLLCNGAQVPSGC